MKYRMKDYLGVLFTVGLGIILGFAVTTGKRNGSYRRTSLATLSDGANSPTPTPNDDTCEPETEPVVGVGSLYSSQYEEVSKFLGKPE